MDRDLDMRNLFDYNGNNPFDGREDVIKNSKSYLAFFNK